MNVTENNIFISFVFGVDDLTHPGLHTDSWWISLNFTSVNFTLLPLLKGSVQCYRCGSAGEEARSVTTELTRSGVALCSCELPCGHRGVNRLTQPQRQAATSPNSRNFADLLRSSTMALLQRGCLWIFLVRACWDIWDTMKFTSLIVFKMNISTWNGRHMGSQNDSLLHQTQVDELDYFCIDHFFN